MQKMWDRDPLHSQNRQIGKVPRAAGFAEDRRLGKDSMMEYLNAVL